MSDFHVTYNDQNVYTQNLTRQSSMAVNKATEDTECPKISLASRIAKRGFDLTVAAVATAVFAIPCVMIGAMIWAEDRKSPIYAQKRVGRNGKEFTLYKFRSMRPDAESSGTPQLCSEEDDRLTKIGSFIRAHHLDEFPQLWNVLKGDMSIVGPRPERPYFVKKIMERIPEHELLFQLRPGLFSEATLRNGYTDTIEKMVRRTEMDLDYLRHQSLALDFKIMYMTTVSILTGKKF